MWNDQNKRHVTNNMRASERMKKVLRMAYVRYWICMFNNLLYFLLLSFWKTMGNSKTTQAMHKPNIYNAKWKFPRRKWPKYAVIVLYHFHSCFARFLHIFACLCMWWAENTNNGSKMKLCIRIAFASRYMYCYYYCCCGCKYINIWKNYLHCIISAISNARAQSHRHEINKQPNSM